MNIHTFMNELQVGPACSHLNLIMYPLTGNDNSTPGYLTLDQSLQTGGFHIGEISIDGSVSVLKVSNGLSQPVLLLDGEELIGAKQNRVLNLTIMVPPEIETTIPVSCVEAGRWQHVSASFAAADRTQFARGRASKLAQVSRSMRAHGDRSTDQSAVWHEIAAKSERMSVVSATGAMSAFYDCNQSILDEFVAAMPPSDGQIGAVFLIDGQIAGVEFFDSAGTFAKTAAKLIRSYAIDAIESAAKAASNNTTLAVVRAFLGAIAATEATRSKAIGMGDDLRFTGPTLAAAALQVSGRIIHLVAFPSNLYKDYGRETPRHALMARARRGGTFH